MLKSNRYQHIAFLFHRKPKMATTAPKKVPSKSPISDKATPATPPKIQEITLASTGDIILLPGATPPSKIKVSFDKLTAASPVFKRMLTGRFAEGQSKRSSLDPQTVPLPDDDAKAVNDMCHLIYHQTQHLTEAPLPADRLFHLVLVTDKYDCMEMLRLQLCALIQWHFDGLSSKLSWEKSALHAGTACILRDAKFFALATSQLMTHFNQPLSGLSKLPGGDVFSPNALLAMAEKRASAQHSLSAELASVTPTGDCDCYNESDYCEGLAELVPGDAQWPPSFNTHCETTLAKILETLEEQRYAIRVDGCTCGFDRGEVWEAAEDAREVCKGLCLECVRGDSQSVPNKRWCEHRKRE